MYQYKPVAIICQEKIVAMPQPQAQAEQHASSMHYNRDQPNLPNITYGTLRQ
jgi:hypothetical protein